MDAMQMAGHLSLEFGAVVEGPFTDPQDGDQVVKVWLPNRRGLSLLWRAETDDIEFRTIRETVPVHGVEYNGTPVMFDYSTPLVNGGERDRVTLDEAREAMTVLRGLPNVDPRDLRSTWRDARKWSTVHYGESRPACGEALRNDDTCTTVVKDVRCMDCLEAVNRPV